MWLRPDGGWQHYARHAEVIERIWEALTLRERGGTWAYVNPMTGISIWEDQASDAWLYLVYEDPKAADRVEELQVERSPVGANLELDRLLETLRQNYGVTGDVDTES